MTIYLREIQFTGGNVITSKLGLFEGTIKDVKKDIEYWKENHIIVSIKYFKLNLATEWVI